MKTLSALFAFAALSASSAHANLACTEVANGEGTNRGIFQCETTVTGAVLYNWKAVPDELIEGGSKDGFEPADGAPWHTTILCANRKSPAMLTEQGDINVYFPFYNERQLGDDGHFTTTEPLDSTHIICRTIGYNDSPIQRADNDVFPDDGVERDAAWGWVGSGAGIVSTGGWNGLGGGDPWWVVPSEDSVIGWWSWDTANDGTGDDWLYGGNDW